MKTIAQLSLFICLNILIGQEPIDYQTEIQTIFNSKCGNCHLGNSSGGLNLSTYQNLMAGGNSGAVIVPGDHANSYLWQRVNNGEMPPGDNPDLTASQVSLVALWIDEGALENPVYTGPVWHVATTGSDATGDGTEENPFATIQTAIDTAGESDTVLVSAGTYFENLIWPPMNGIKLIGSGEESCTIDGDSTGRVITFLDSLNGIIDTNTLITGFTIQNGYSDPDNSIETPGGGIYCSNSSPIFTDCTIKENFAYGDGGGIVLADSANAILLNVKIENNVAKGRQIPGFPPTRFQGKGGGVFIYNSDPIFTGVDIRDNYAGYNGAGVYILYSSPVFSDFTISGNGGSGYLQKGGGVSCEGTPNAIFIGGEISNNGNSDIGAAPYIGGGIFVGVPVMDTLSSFHVELTNVLIQNNVSRVVGGGVSGRNISLAGCTIKENTSDHKGGGIFSDGEIAFSTINRCNIYSNTIEDSSQTGNEIAIGLDADSIALSFLDVILDSFTVSTPTDFYTTPIASYTFDILVGLDNLQTQLVMTPLEFTLYPNYPNPFNPVTTLRYDLPENGLVNIIIYDMLGRQVKTLINHTQDAGYRSVIWDATNDFGKPVSAGIYLYQIQAGEYISTKKMVLLK